ncbi:NB-ARC domain-containing protein [Frankia sp. AgKG'84/4]
MSGARRIFLSHTAELRRFPRERSFVAAAERAVALAGDRVIDMAYFGAQDADPAEFCVRTVRASEVYLGLIGFRYGSPVPGRPDVSHTELEFEAATAAGIPRLVFLLDDNAEVPFGEFVDETYGARQRAFRDRLRDSGIITADFRGAGDLTTAVLDALVKLRETQRRAAATAVRAGYDGAGPNGAGRPEPHQPAAGPGGAAGATGAAAAARPAVPWMLPADRGGLVARPGLAAAVLGEVLAPPAAAVVLHGTGGIGKTTLTKDVCRRPEIAARFPGGLLWVTVGESLGGAQLADRINDLSEALSGARPALSDPEQAGFHLGTLLGDERRLLVVDDVWYRSQLAPFLQGGAHTVRLVTTRQRDLAPRARAIEIPAMATAEALSLLLLDLPGPTPAQEARLLTVTGGWPVLLSLVNRALVRHVRDGMSAPRAVDRVLRRLERRGPTGLDVSRAAQRTEAVEATLAASLGLLTGDRLDRYLELAVFPEDVPIPRGVLEAYWAATGDLDRDEVDDLCQEFADLSLVVAYRRSPPTLLLQDVLRTYLRIRVGPSRLAALEGVLCDALRDACLPAEAARAAWWLLAEPAGGAAYAWTYLVGHLVGAGRVDEAVALLSDLRWTLAKLGRPQLGPVAVEADLAIAAAARPAEPVLAGLRRVILQNAHLLAPTDPPAALGAILLSRLDDAPELDEARLALATHVARPRLMNGWTRPDQPHPAMRRTLTGHHGRVQGLAVAPDDRLLVSAGHDGTVRLWTLPQGRQAAVLREHTGEVHGCAVAPDGRLLASAGADGTVQLWHIASIADLEDDPPVAGHVLRGPAGAVTACAFTPDGARIVAVGADGYLRGWDVADGSPVLEVAVSAAGLRCCLPTARWIAVGGDDGLIRLCDPATGEPTGELAGHVGAVLSLTCPADAAWLGSSGWDGTFRRWSPGSGRPLGLIRDPAGPIRGAAVARDGWLLVATSWEGALRLWDLRDGSLRANLTSGIGSRHCVLSADGSWVAAAARFGTIRLWDTDVDLPKPPAAGRDASMRGTVVVRSSRPVAAAGADHETVVSPPLVVAYSENGAVAAWELNSGEPTGINHRIAVDTARSSAVAPVSSWVLVPGDHTELIRWDPVTGDVGATMTADAEIKAWAVDPTGTWVLGACGDGTVRRWSAATGRPLPPTLARPGRRPPGPVLACAISPDGHWVATGGEDNAVTLWDPDRWPQTPPAGARPSRTAPAAMARELVGHTDNVLGLGFSPDSRLLASAGADHTVRVWRVEDGGPVATLRGHGHTVRDARFSPDGTMLATLSGDGSMRIWDAASWRPLTVMRFDGAARSGVWLPAELGRGIIVACSAGLFRYDLES